MSGDNHTPHADGRWSFNESVTANFDQMLRSSIPEYENMRKLTYALGSNILRRSQHTDDSHNIVDIGASRGEALAAFLGSGADMLYAVETSKPMLDVMRTRFADNNNVGVLDLDLRRIDATTQGFAAESNQLVLSILTLQFVAMEYRQRILKTIYDSLKVGGGFILVEKILGAGQLLDDMFVDEYYGLKGANGYSKDDIAVKRASLEGVLVPLTAKMNEELLTSAGFKVYDGFYRSLNFAGWVCLK